MAFVLKLPSLWESRGWKAKIRDRERVEPPHVTILFKTKAWRLALRNGQFLDKEPDPKDIPQEVIESVRARFALLGAQWDRMYPENPILSKIPRPKPKRKHK